MTKKKKAQLKPEDLGDGLAGKAASKVKKHNETMQERIARETGIKGGRWGK